MFEIVFAFVCCLCIIKKYKERASIRFADIDIAFFFWAIWVGLQLVYQNIFILNQICFLLLLMFSYLLGRHISYKAIVFGFISMIAAGFFLCLYYLIFDVTSLVGKTLLSDNSSLTAVQLSILISGCIWMAMKASSYKRIAFIIISLVLLFTVLLLDSRTAIISIIASVCFSGFPRIIQSFKRKSVISILTFIVIAVAIGLAFLVKVQSTAGRWFIWYNSTNLFLSNYSNGVGIGLFNPNYNHFQAQYFSCHSLIDSTALLVNDGYYAFNELLQIAVEQGMFGVLFFVYISYLVIKTLRDKLSINEQLIIAILIPIIVSSFLGYPLHNKVLAATLFLILGFLSAKSNTRFEMPIQSRPYLSATLILFFLAFCFMNVKLLKADYKFKLAQDAYEEGYKTQAYNLCKEASSILHADYSFTLFYHRLLFETGRLSESIDWFSQYHRYHCNQESHELIGKAFQESGEFKKSEFHYLQSLYITPQLLQSRLNLMDLYLEKKDSLKAGYWADQIIKTPIKVFSKKAEDIKQQAIVFRNKSQ